jgi:hypothetical protein
MILEIRQDLRDSIIKVICLGKCFKTLIKEKYGLDDDADVAEYWIPSTFEEETNFLSTDNIKTLRIHYLANYWQIRKDYLEDFTTQESSCKIETNKMAFGHGIS